MATTTGSGTGDEADPRAQLAMLDAVQDAAEVEAWMPPTPPWHAPILATAFAGLTLVTQGPSSWTIPGAVMGAAAAAFGLVDQARRQRASPRRMRRPLRVLAFYGFMTAFVYGIVVMWGRLDLSDRSGEAAPALLGAWLASTVAFAIGLSITNRMRNHWAEPLQ